jgi:nicotinamidase/pyrazinamidase
VSGAPIFWDVDTQVDFMLPHGRLYVPGAERIIPNLARLSGAAHARGIRVVASADDHVPGHVELSDRPDYQRTFPPHCLRGTPGQAKIAETQLRDPLLLEPDSALDIERVHAHRGDVLLHKHFFDVFTSPNASRLLELLDPVAITVYGVALDVCVRFAVEGIRARRPDTILRVVSDACRALVPERGEQLLERWKSQGVALITTDQALTAD